MRIAHLSAECVPFAKTGGLGDVAGSLPKAQAARGDDAAVFMPFHLEAARWYRRRGEWPEGAVEPFDVSILGQPHRVGVLRGTLPGSNVPAFFVACDPLFHRRSLYAGNEHGEDDGIWRFSVFVRAAIETMKRLPWKPHVLHVHDWHPALAAMLTAWSSWRDRWFDDVSDVLTIHNVGFQGVYPAAAFPTLGLPAETWTGGAVEFDGHVNLLKGAIVAADMVTAVSPTYASEIRTPDGGAGLDSVLQARHDRLVGILNGIDTAVWNPSLDPSLPAHYSRENLVGKAECRGDLLRLAGMDPGDPAFVVGAIGRLTDQKGFDLLLTAAPELIRRGVRIVMLGSGEPAVEGAMRLLEHHAPGRFKGFVGYDESVAHRIEAGADAFVMPSRFEPCGLNQMYSLVYGTPPIVRKTGGLADSVTGFDGTNLDAATGFHFEDPSAHALAAAILFAQRVFFHRDVWRRLVENGMSKDFSWGRSAERYEAVYRRARALRGLPA